MTKSERKACTEELLAMALAVGDGKSIDYASTGDELANFKRNAERLGMTPFQVWAVYWNKHVDSINNAIARNPAQPSCETEPLCSRLVDLINYEILLHCLLSETSPNHHENRL